MIRSFAETYRKNYLIYLITNLGKGIDTELRIVENVYEKIELNKLQTVSRRFRL